MFFQVFYQVKTTSLYKVVNYVKLEYLKSLQVFNCIRPIELQSLMTNEFHKKGII